LQRIARPEFIGRPAHALSEVRARLSRVADAEACCCLRPGVRK
jgi:hypothetical protein